MFKTQIQYFIFFTLFGVIQISFASSEVLLSKQEQDWIKLHPILTISPDPDYAPYEFFSSSGEYMGIGADYIKLIQQKTGLNFSIVKLKNWASILKQIKLKQLDLLPLTTESKRRDDFLLFSKAYYQASVIIISAQEYKDIESLYGHKMAVVDGYVYIDYIKQYHPEINTVIVENTETGLELVSLGAVESMIGNLPTLANKIEILGLNNIRIVKHLKQHLDFRVAIRKDWPILVGILNKALDSITAVEHQKIKEKWTALNNNDFWLKPIFWYSLLSIIVVLTLLVILIIIWNRSLSKQVLVRSKELQQTRAKLIHAEKMETIGRLAAGIAHEVKNPLAIIQMGIDFLSLSTTDSVELEVIKDIDDAVQRADKVIKGLLDFSRDKNLEKKETNLNKIIKESLHLVAHEMNQRNIKVDCDLSENLPKLSADFNKLEQVFINLFMNAAHAMNKDGKLSVTSTLTIIRSRERVTNKNIKINDKVMAVNICDDGHGFEEANDSKIFEPFYSTKPQGEGTGLGLFVSKNILELHNGSIDIKNRVEGGVSVMLYFPLN
jgi:signal transduction histidine kinase